MILQVKAKHFNGNGYGNNCNCPLAKAAKEQFCAGHVYESVTYIEIGDATYTHPEYNIDTFQDDQYLASQEGYDETVIREIELTEII